MSKKESAKEKGVAKTQTLNLCVSSDVDCVAAAAMRMRCCCDFAARHHPRELVFPHALCSPTHTHTHLHTLAHTHTLGDMHMSTYTHTHIGMYTGWSITVSCCCCCWCRSLHGGLLKAIVVVAVAVAVGADDDAHMHRLTASQKSALLLYVSHAIGVLFQ